MNSAELKRIHRDFVEDHIEGLHGIYRVTARMRGMELILVVEVREGFREELPAEYRGLRIVVEEVLDL